MPIQPPVCLFLGVGCQAASVVEADTFTVGELRANTLWVLLGSHLCNQSLGLTTLNHQHIHPLFLFS